MAFPTTMFDGTPLFCSMCDEEKLNCEFMEARPGFKRFNALNDTDPGFNGGWVRKKCTAEAVDYFTQYFPYALIVIPLIMLAVEMAFDGYL